MRVVWGNPYCIAVPGEQDRNRCFVHASPPGTEVMPAPGPGGERRSSRRPDPVPAFRCGPPAPVFPGAAPPGAWSRRPPSPLPRARGRRTAVKVRRVIRPGCAWRDHPRPGAVRVRSRRGVNSTADLFPCRIRGRRSPFLDGQGTVDGSEEAVLSSNSIRSRFRSSPERVDRDSRGNGGFRGRESDVERGVPSRRSLTIQLLTPGVGCCPGKPRHPLLSARSSRTDEC